MNHGCSRRRLEKILFFPSTYAAMGCDKAAWWLVISRHIATNSATVSVPLAVFTRWSTTQTLLSPCWPPRLSGTIWSSDAVSGVSGRPLMAQRKLCCSIIPMIIFAVTVAGCGITPSLSLVVVIGNRIRPTLPTRPAVISGGIDSLHVHAADSLWPVAS